jgi:hypothetical protein
MSNIPHQLTQLFEHHRIVFWYGDDDAQLHRKYTEATVADDATKMRVLVDEPKVKFLPWGSRAATDFLALPPKTLHLRAAAQQVLTDYASKWYVLPDTGIAHQRDFRKREI